MHNPALNANMGGGEWGTLHDFPDLIHHFWPDIDSQGPHHLRDHPLTSGQLTAVLYEASECVAQFVGEMNRGAFILSHISDSVQQWTRHLQCFSKGITAFLH